MKQPSLKISIVFRILFPVAAGLILYMAMLMVFGSLDQLAENFFSQEALFIILLTYLNYEWSVFRLKTQSSSEIFTSGRTVGLMIHLALVIGITLILTSVTMLCYFILILGYYHFLTELITVNVLMVLFQMLIHLYYIGIIQISHLHAVSMEQEEILKEQLELELETFQNEMNPGLLMDCLETLIALIHRDVQDADRYIKQLSDHYRYLLDNRQREFTEMVLELKSLKGLVYLLGKAGTKDLSLEYADGLEISRAKIIPGTLGFIAFFIVNNLITSPLSPVHIQVSMDEDENILVSCSGRLKLMASPVSTGSLTRLNRSYDHYTGSGISVSHEKEGRMAWKVPHIPEILEE